MAYQNVPGTVWKSHGSWHWRVTLPGEKKRRDIVLTFPFSGKRVPAECPQSVAEDTAFRIWDERMAKVQPPKEPVFTVNDLCDRWIVHAQTYYRRHDGSPTGREKIQSNQVRDFRELFGRYPVEALTHPDLLRLRDRLVERDLARTTINGILGTIRGIFAWALDEALVSTRTKAELTQIANLKAFRSKARETEPVRAVADDTIERTCALLPESLADLVRVNRLTGMRPAEACLLSWDRIERVGGVWAYRPSRHKTDWRNQARVVVLGPKAQAILSKYAGAPGFIFSPARALAERAAQARAARVEPLREGEDARREAARRAAGMAPRKVAERWDTHAYCRAIARVCDENGIERWSPNQLRHSCATAVRRRFGISAARAVLGHSLGMRITDRYSFEAAEDEIIREATPAALALG